MRFPEQSRPTTSLPLCLLKLLCSWWVQVSLLLPTYTVHLFCSPILHLLPHLRSCYFIVFSLCLSLFLSACLCLSLSLFFSSITSLSIHQLLSFSLTIKHHRYMASIQQTTTNVCSVIFNINETKVFKSKKAL